MMQSNKKKQKSLISGSVVAILIAISPYIFYLYESVPLDIKSWETYFFTITTDKFVDVNLMVWLFMGKFVPILLLVLWFFTCKHWWYHIILIPIAMFSFQLFSVVNDDARFVDEVELVYIIPIMMVIIPFVYLIRLKLFDKVVYGIDLQKINEELEELKDVEDFHDDSLDIK